MHAFYIPNSYYVSQGKVRLLSLQHWSQCQKDTKPTPGTLETTTHDTCTLQWDQQKYKRTVKLSKLNNVATFRLAPGFRQFEAYAATAGFHTHDNEYPIIAKEAHIIEDDEE